MDSFPVGEAAGPPLAPGTNPRDRTPSGRNARRKRPQPYAFWKAAAIGLVPLLPAIGVTLWLLARLGVGNSEAGIVEVLRLTVVFAGLATVLTAGGVGRLAAEAGAERGRRHAAWVGGRTLGVAGAGLVVLASIPLDGIPAAWPGWTALMGAGAALGGTAGVLIGWLVGGPMPTLSELGVPERLQVDPLRMLRRTGRRGRRPVPPGP